jgi:hypothetical protein
MMLPEKCYREIHGENVKGRSSTAANAEQVPFPRFNGERVRVRGKSFMFSKGLGSAPHPAAATFSPLKRGEGTWGTSLASPPQSTEIAAVLPAGLQFIAHYKFT